MTARSLFLKIFLWFWLANTLVIAALALVVWIYPFAEARRPGRFDLLHELQVRGAIAVLESKGREAFEQHAAELEMATGFRTYWLDEKGHELRNQVVPASVLQAAKDYGVEALHDRRRIDLGPPHPIAIPLTDSKGQTYLAMAEPSGPGPEPYFKQLVSSRVFLLWVVAGVLTAGFGCYALARYLTSPVWQLQRAAQRLGAGDLTARVDERLAARGDEIGELGREFNRMAQRVDTLFTSQKRLLRDVSHELRSPLARLYLALGIASRDADPRATAALERVGREAEQINELIGQLLVLARLEGAGTQSDQIPVDLHQLVMDVAADADFEAESQQRHVRVLRCDPCEVLGTPQLLHSAIENVVRNAVCYTAVGSEVEVTLTVEKNGAAHSACITVRDHGSGVPAEALEKIFQPFYRVSDARERDSGGSGLGLAITERAVRLHHGDVLASNAAGGGLLIRIELPCA